MLLPGLTNSIEFASIVLPGYKLLQYGSTIFGLPFLTGLVWIKLKRQKSIINYFHIPRRWNLSIFSGFCWVPVAISYYNLQQSIPFKSIVGQAIKQSIGAELLLFLICAILYKFWLANNHR